MNTINKINYQKIKNGILMILLSIWILIPLLKEIKLTAHYVNIHEYDYMKILAIVGIYIITYEIYKKFLACQNKKDFLKELLPILILLLYLIWTLISVLCAKDKELAFWGTSYRQDGYITYLTYAGFFACAFLIESKKIRKYLLNLFVFVATVNVILFQLTNYGYLYNIFRFQNPTLGVFYNSNHYGYYLLMALTTIAILFITEKNKISKALYILSYILVLYYFILNNTFGCYIAFFITIIIFFVYEIYKKENVKASVVFLTIFIIMSFAVQSNGENIVMKNVSVLFTDIGKIINIDTPENGIIDKQLKENNSNYSDDTKIKNKNKNEIDNQEYGSNSNKESSSWQKAGSGRAQLWKYGIQIFLEKPIIGYGPENLEKEYDRFNIQQDRPHNLIIQLATTSGIIGLLLYCTAIGIIIIKGIKKLKEKESMQKLVLFVIIAYLISAMFGNSMYYTSPYFFIFLGWLMRDNIENKYI